MTSPPRSLLYVSAESLAEGSAAHVHVNEIMAGLSRREWRTKLVQPAYDKASGPPSLLQRLLAIMRVNWNAWRSLREVDAVYCRSNPLLLPLSWLARRRGLVVVHECNGPYADFAIAHPQVSRVSGFLTSMQRWQYRNADAVIAVTERLRQWLEGERGRPGVHLISNAANTDLFTPEVASEAPAEQPFVAFFGALAAWHGADMMLEAVAHPDWPKNVSLVVIGEGAESAKVKAAAALDPRIVVLGRQPYKRIPSLIVGAAAGLVPIVDVSGRAQTGLAPLKLFETLACGLPVIATEYPTQADFVREHNCGIVVAPGDAPALARAVAAITSDPAAAKAMGRRGREAVVRAHSWDQRAGQVDDLLRGLAQTGK